MATYKKLLKNRAGDTIIPVTEPPKSIYQNPFTAKSGFEITEANVIKCGNRYSGYVLVHKTTGNFSGNQESLATMSVTPLRNLNFFGITSNDRWGVPVGHAYCYIGAAKELIGRGTTGGSWMKMYVDFLEAPSS